MEKTIDSYRIMTKMLLDSMETEISDFIRNNSGSDVEGILRKKFNQKKQSLNRNANLDEMVSELYTLELFEIALKSAKTLEEKESLKKIFDTLVTINLKDARNAASHANKPFYKSYWYKTAYLASLYEWEKLKFNKVLLQLEKAERGEIKF